MKIELDDVVVQDVSDDVLELATALLTHSHLNNSHLRVAF